MILSDLTYKINGCAMKVHSKLGCGFQEVIYQRALAIELQRAKLPFIREMEQTIHYDDIEIGTRRVDFLVMNTVVIELKAVSALLDVHFAQIKNYLVAYNMQVGLLINFGEKSLSYKKVYHPNMKVDEMQEV